MNIEFDNTNEALIYGMQACSALTVISHTIADRTDALGYKLVDDAVIEDALSFVAEAISRSFDNIEHKIKQNKLEAAS